MMSTGLDESEEHGFQPTVACNQKSAALAGEHCGKRLARLLALAATLASASPALAEYKIGPGDVLALTVISVVELNTRAPVDSDGKIVLPLIGDLPVAGLSLAEATALIRTELPRKELDRRLDDGRTMPVIVAPSQISLSVAEYRPVYVSGDVAKPGEITFRPGLTVRQAVTLAGGFDLVRFKLNNPIMEISELTGEANALWVEYAKQEAAISRLRAEIDGKTEIDGGALAGVPIGKALTEDVLTTERGQLKARNDEFSQERDYLAAASQHEAQRADILRQQEVKELEGLKIDSADLQRYDDLFKKGAIALPGVSEARRTVLASSTRALQTTAALASVEREQGDLDHRLQSLGNTRQVQALHDLQEATTNLAGTKAKLQAVNTKLRYAGAVKSQLVRGFDSRVIVNITRSVNGRTTEITGEPNATLQPGDVVEIVLPASDPLFASP